MNSIENVAKKIRNLEEANQDFVNSYEESLREMVREGEEFLKKYEFYERGIALLDESNLNRLLKDLSMTIEHEDIFSATGCLLDYHKSTFSNEEKYTLNLPMEFSGNSLTTIAPSSQKVCLAYAIGFRIFRERNVCEFEIIKPFSIRMSDTEKAFIYSLIMPYTRYRELFRECCEDEWKKKGDFNRITSFTHIWNQIACQTFSCPTNMGILILDFYQNLFFDELSQIWKEEIIEHFGKQIEKKRFLDI